MYPNLKLQMWRAGLRQNRLARMLDIDETNLSRIVNGFRKPGPELKQRIAALLETDQDWLFEVEPPHTVQHSSPEHAATAGFVSEDEAIP